MYICERCRKAVVKVFGSGRFCSYACSNKRKHTEETKTKMKNSWNAYKEKGRLHPNYSLVSKRGGIYQSNRKHIRNRIELDITNGELKLYREKHKACEICGKKYGFYYALGKKETALCVDHQHNNNHFRGLLCSQCNRALGWYENNKEAINSYLQRNQQV